MSLTNHIACYWHNQFLILRPATNFQGEEVDDLLPRLHGLRRRHPASDRQLDPLLRQEHEELQAAPPHRPLHHAPLSAQVGRFTIHAPIRGDMIPTLDPDPESDFQSGDSGSRIQ